jgi:hypothetical protein
MSFLFIHLETAEIYEIMLHDGQILLYNPNANGLKRDKLENFPKIFDFLGFL